MGALNEALFKISCTHDSEVIEHNLTYAYDETRQDYSGETR